MVMEKLVSVSLTSYKMKILFTQLTVTPYSHALINKLSSKGYHFVLLLPQKEDGNVGKGVKTVNDKTSNLYKLCYSRTKQMWYGKTALIDLKYYLLQEKPDILMMIWPYFLQLYFDCSILEILRKHNIKLMIREIPFQVPPFGKLSYFKENPVYNENMELLSRGISFSIRSLFTMYIRRYVYRRTDAAICYTSLAKNVLPTYGMDENGIFYGNTSDTDSLISIRNRIISENKISKKGIKIIHIGRLVKWKRVDLLIDAFKIVLQNNPDSELIIIGDGPEKNNLECQAERLNLSERVNFVGAVYDSYLLGEYMYQSTVYVLAGMGGLSINDAMCFSLPIICSVCDGTEKDLVIDGENGFFFKEGDAVSLAGKINLILSDEQQAKKMGEKSYQIISEKNNIESVSNIFIDSFKYALKNEASKKN